MYHSALRYTGLTKASTGAPGTVMTWIINAWIGEYVYMDSFACVGLRMVSLACLLPGICTDAFACLRGRRGGSYLYHREV